MKIVFTTFEYPPGNLGGAGIYASCLTRELAKLGHEITVITPAVSDRRSEENHDGVNLIRVPVIQKPFLKAPSFWASLPIIVNRISRRQNVDIVHSNGTDSIFLPRRRGIGYFATIHHVVAEYRSAQRGEKEHGLESLRGESALISLAERLVAGRVSGILVPSKSTRDALVKHHGIDTSKIFVTPEAARPLLGGGRNIAALPTMIPLDKKKILSVGRIEPRKRIEDTILAFSIALKSNPDLVLIHAGRGDSTHLKEVATGLGVQDSLYTLGEVNDSVLGNLYMYCDLLVQTSVTEGFGLTIVEAMSKGLPVALPDSGLSRELVVPGKTGLLFTPGDMNDLAEKILSLLSNEEMRHAMGEQGLLRYQSEYSWSSCAKKTQEAYETILSKAG
jgi:glycosyltransferase involved in cell wall biosynthesis